MPLKDLKARACAAIDEEAQALNKISREIWEHPELFYKEHHAHRILTDFLEKHRFKVERSFKLETAFRATYEQGDGPHIAVLCEYDALPNVNHGCGHNLIAEVGVAAGLAIKSAMESTSQSIGKLTVLGTPAEEMGGGKVDLIREGVFDDVTVAMMAHPGHVEQPDTKSLAMCEVYVTYRGKASHASDSPWEGVNALDAGVMAYQAISNMRQQLRPSWRIHGIFLKAGVAPNIIPEECKLHYFLRTPTATELEVLVTKAAAVFRGAATSTGCQVEFEWGDKPYENVIHNEVLTRLYTDNCVSLGVKFDEPLATSTGSTDMGNVSHVVPAFHPHFKIAHKVATHTHEFCAIAGTEAAQKPTLDTAKSIAMTAMDIFTQPHLLDEIKTTFAKDIEWEKNLI